MRPAYRWARFAARRCARSSASRGRRKVAFVQTKPKSSAEERRRSEAYSLDCKALRLSYYPGMATLTVEHFDQLPEEEIRRWELLDGELIEVPDATPWHNYLVLE